jgi:hypothetical protein
MTKKPEVTDAEIEAMFGEYGDENMDAQRRAIETHEKLHLAIHALITNQPFVGTQKVLGNAITLLLDYADSAGNNEVEDKIVATIMDLRRLEKALMEQGIAVVWEKER